MKTGSITAQLSFRTRIRALLGLAIGLLAGAAAQAQEQRAATAVATIVNGYVFAVTVTDGGAGYAVAPAVTMSGGGGSGATAVATVANGAVEKIIVTTAGFGYTSTPEVVIAPPPPPEAPLLESVRLQSAVTIRATVGTTNWILVADLPTPYAWRILTNVVVTSNPYVFVDTEAAPWQRYYQVAAGPEAPVSPPWMPDTNKFAWIPPGTFTMGSPSGEQDSDNSERPLTVVTLTEGYWMGRKEVTQAQYQAVIGTNPSNFTGDLQRPVEEVSWNDATNYCGKLTQQLRNAGRLPSGYEYRLPTEAQWEYACRGGTTTRFSFGDDPGYSLLSNYAWYDSNSGSATHDVGTKQPNPWGLYDMHGNVWEWCQDWYGTYPGGNVTNYTGRITGSAPVFRMFRGGSWGGNGQFCRSARRYYCGDPSFRHVDLGFRVVIVQVP